MRWKLSIVVLLAAAALRLEAVPITIAEIPFQYREGLLWVDVHIPQSGQPLHFLLDTGAETSVINLNTAKRVGLKLGRPVPVRGVGKVLTGYWESHIQAQAGPMQLPAVYLAVDLQTLSQSCQQAVDGLIGMDFFRGRLVQIDYVAKKIRILKPQKGEKNAGGLPLDLRSSGMRVPITINGRGDQWVRLDTGCATPLQWVTTSVDTNDCVYKMAIGLAEVSVPQTKTTVRLGTAQFEDVPTGLHQTPIFPGEAGLLGNGLLARFSSVTIDTRAKHVFLGPFCEAP